MGFDFFVEDNQGSLLSDPILVHATATTDSGGAFTVDLTNVGYTSVVSFQASTLDTASGVTNTTVTSVTTFNTTTISGNVYEFTSLLGVLGLSAVGSGRTVYVTVVGSLT